MRGVRDHDLAPLCVFTLGREIGVEEHQPGQLTLAACRGLQADRVETGHLDEDLLQPPLELEGALRGVVLDEGMQAGESGQRRRAAR